MKKYIIHLKVNKQFVWLGYSQSINAIPSKKNIQSTHKKGLVTLPETNNERSPLKGLKGSCLKHPMFQVRKNCEFHPTNPKEIP